MGRMRDLIPLAGRILIALPFIKFGTDKIRNWDMVVPWMQSMGLPAPALLLGLATGIEVIGAICLILGFWTRWVALTMALYLIPVHLLIHNFWAVAAAQRSSEIESFGKGMMIIGGLLFVMLFGAGRISVDARARPQEIHI